MIRIQGAVRAANRAKQKLKQGITPQEVTSFQQFVNDSIKAIEQICIQAELTPKQLPAPSRQAYHFLQNIDLNNLPLIHSQSIATATSVSKLHLKNVLKKQGTIQQHIERITANSTPQTIQSLSQTLANCTAEIEKICSERQLTPAALNTPSRRAYAWMKFLTEEDNLQLHLDALYRARTLGQKIMATQRQNKIKVKVELTNFACLYKYKTTPNQTHLQLSEGFIQADDDILTAVMKVALEGKSKKEVRLVRQFGLTEAYQDVILELDLIADVAAETPLGDHYNLDELFEKVNREYFESNLDKPRLTWNRVLTKRKFGHYEKARDRVAIGQILDDRRIPEFVVEFVLYHELLHKHHGISWVKGKCRAHTPAFRRSERQFRFYREASEWLKKLVEGRS
jgi:hypothetical protein